MVNHLRQRNLRNKVKIVIGGQAVSEQTCKEYCVDAYAKDAQDYVEKVKRLIGASQSV